MQDINPETGSGLAAAAAPMAEHTPGNEFTVVANWEYFCRMLWAYAPFRVGQCRPRLLIRKKIQFHIRLTNQTIWYGSWIWDNAENDITQIPSPSLQVAPQ